MFETLSIEISFASVHTQHIENYNTLSPPFNLAPKHKLNLSIN